MPRTADYETLHEAMESDGFERTITSDDTKRYRLPSAEYYRETNLNRTQVVDSANPAAGKTGKSYGMIVAESLGLT